MRFLGLILSFILGRMNKQQTGLRAIALEIFEDVVEKSRKLVTLSVSAIGALIFFCGGLFIALIDATTQYDRNGYIFMTATFSAGLGLVIFAAAGFLYIFLRAWPGAHRARHTRKEKSRESQAAPNLEHALSLLVMDFIKERESKRQSAERSRSERPRDSHRSEGQRPSPIH